MAEDPEPKPPRFYAPPPSELAPVFLQDEPRPVLGTAVGPRRQERALIFAVHVPAGESSASPSSRSR